MQPFLGEALVNRIGYIYFASNTSMPGLLKIGFTNVSPSERLPELHSTGVPTPFALEACFRVVNTAQVEQRLHAILTKWRLASNREFFQVSLAEALAHCFPILTDLLVAASSEAESPKHDSVPTEEEQIMLFIAEQTKTKRKPTRGEIQQHFKLSDVKADYVLGGLLKRRFVREVNDERKRTYNTGDYESYAVKAMKLEHVGIQYLLDNQLLTHDRL